MPALTLPRLHWGNPDSDKRALMAHGLGSSAQTCWQVMEALAEDGWSATAVDLRGHGSAPRASSYRIADFAMDLVHTHPQSGGGWDVVIGHSIGAAAAVVASHENHEWAKSLILLDPALALDNSVRTMILDNQRLGHLHHDVADVEAANPLWHPLDVQVKVAAHRAASLYALEHAVFDNDPWDVTQHAESLNVPTYILGAEEKLGSMFTGEYAKNLVAGNDNVRWDVIPGAGHGVHRDKPHETIVAIRDFLS